MSPRTAKQLLSPTIFNNENIQQINQIDGEEMSNAEAEIIQLKDNFLPVGLTPLEDIFDSNDKQKILNSKNVHNKLFN